VTQKNNWTKNINDQEPRLLRDLSRRWFAILEIEKISWVLTGTAFLLDLLGGELMGLLFQNSPNQYVSFWYKVFTYLVREFPERLKGFGNTVQIPKWTNLI
jgi:hypothetical protein